MSKLTKKLAAGRKLTALEEAALRFAMRNGKFIRLVAMDGNCGPQRYDWERAGEWVRKNLDCADFPAVADKLENMSPAAFKRWTRLVLGEVL